MSNHNWLIITQLVYHPIATNLAFLSLGLNQNTVSLGSSRKISLGSYFKSLAAVLY